MAPKTYQIQQLLEKMLSPDQDFRFMALNDLMAEVAHDRAIFAQDDQSEVKVLNQVLALIEDKISEVKNQAVKCLGQLIKIMRESNLNLVVDKLVDFSSRKEEELRDVAGLALKTVVSELPPDGKLAQTACIKLMPKLLEQLKKARPSPFTGSLHSPDLIYQPSTPPETILETLSTLSVLVTRFPQHLAQTKDDPVSIITPLLTHSRPAVRKRAISTLAQFLPIVPEDRFSDLLKTNVIPSLSSSASAENKKTVVQLVGGIARYSPHKLGPAVGDVMPGILAASSVDDSDLREGCLQTLEALILRCPTEVTPHLSSVITIANAMVKYDPNYAGDEDDEDESMEDAEDDDDDDDVADDYSDDEDTSYKVRRSAAKLIAAIIGTRPELISTIYRTVSPVLISRFGDREESVKLEIWTTYSQLIKQTGVYGGAQQAKSWDTGKRKRNEGMEVEDTPYTLLKGQVQPVSRALLKQLRPKSSVAVLQAGFGMMQGLLQVLPGSLTQQADAIVVLSSSVLSSSSTTTTANLHAVVLSFLALFFSSHPPSSFQSSLPRLTGPLLAAASQRHPRVASDALRAFSALLNSMKPIESADWIDPLYNEVVTRLRSNDTDTEVRQCAEDVVADLWLNASTVVKTKDGKEWDALMRGNRTDGAVQVITKVAAEVDMDDAWVSSSTEWTAGVLRRPGKAGKAAAFTCLQTLLRRCKSGIPSHIPHDLVPQLQGFLSFNDLVLLTHALTTLAILLTLFPKEIFPLVESSILPQTYQIAYSPAVSGSALEALTDFFCALVVADSQIATHVVPGLVQGLEKSSSADTSPSNVSKCISAVIKGSPGIAAGTIAEFSKAIKPGSKSKDIHVVLSLLALGEIGRTIDMERQPEIFHNALAFFSADAEAVRSAAAFAAGNIAVGNIHVFFPVLITQVKTNEKRLLSLHALREVNRTCSGALERAWLTASVFQVVSHCQRQHLETVASALWVPLFEMSDTAEETTRNLAAACLGRLTTANPSSYLPELRARLSDPSASVRATVVAAIRYTLADTTQTYDDLLSPVIMDFVALVHDSDLTVRRLSLSTLNAAARNKPHLIREHLATLMPLLYEETKIKKELIRIVEMGPWKHRVDDGLEARKTTYETMYTILDTCLDRIDIHEFLQHVLLGLKDEANEIKVLCHMMLFRLAQVAPTAVSQRLDDAAVDLANSMKGHNVGKDTVKQDLERTAELQRSTLRAIVALSKISSPGASMAFDQLVENVSRAGQPWAQEFRELHRLTPVSADGCDFIEVCDNLQPAGSNFTTTLMKPPSQSALYRAASILLDSIIKENGIVSALEFGDDILRPDPNTSTQSELLRNAEALRQVSDSLELMFQPTIASLNHSYNSRLPIGQLPIEILEGILLLSIDNAHEHYERLSHLSRVSKQWRDVTLFSPRFHAIINDRHSLSANKKHLEYSGAAPLHLVCRDNGSDESFVDLIRPESRRWASIVFTGDGAQYPFVDLPTPKLADLHLIGTRGAFVKNDGVASIRHLWLERCAGFLPLELSSAPFARLETLRLEGEVGPSWKVLIKFLSSSRLT
ncbi:hypothetical protein FRB99_007676, partial [Tulasnella sp. 403]